MKIERVEVYPLVGELDEPFGWSQKWTSERRVVVVRVWSDSGAYGWGETGGGPGTLPLFREVCGGVIGEDARRIGAVCGSIVRDHYQGGGYSGYVSNVVSALDIALHDLLGREYGVPVSELLGGRVRDAVAVYATGLYYTPSDLVDASWSDFLDEGEGYAASGFTGMKMKIGGLRVSDDLDRVARLRERVGEGVRIMVDANEAYDPMTALEVARGLADWDVTWFEEPCSSRELDDNRLVRDTSPVPISGGESASTRRDVARMLRDRVYDIIQPEIVNVGGITELKFSAGMADALNVRFVPHFWNSGISFAAILHTLSTVAQSPPSYVREPYVNEPVTEFDQTPHPLRSALTDPIFSQEESHVRVPTSPGLGIEVDVDALRHFLDGEPCVVDRKA